MSNPRVLVAGGVNVDTTFQMDALPGIGETVHAKGSSQAMGGKGLNQALAVQRAGVSAALLGAIGQDANGRAIREFIVREGITSLLSILSGHATGQAIIHVDRTGNNMIVVVPGANAAADEISTEMVGDAWKSLEAVVANGEVPLNLVEQLFIAARDRGVKTVWNPSPVPREINSVLAQTDILIVNESEAREISQSSGGPAELANALGLRGPAEVVLTLGAAGSVVWTGGTLVEVEATPVTAVDTTAAGDTFLGYYVVARCEGQDPEASAQLASEAAALCVQALGASNSIPKRLALSQARSRVGNV